MKKIIIILALFVGILAVPGILNSQSLFTTDSVNISDSSCLSLNHNLYFGSGDFFTGGEVTKLQKFLVANHYGTFTPTGYFGPLTLQAVIHFQQSQNITPSVGFVGPITRAKIHDQTCGVTLPPTPAPQSVSISSLSPSTGRVGRSVTIYGKGFTSTGNSVSFDERILSNISSSNGTSLVFIVPDNIAPPCAYSKPSCDVAVRIVEPGNYSVSVTNSNGNSNTLTFTVTVGN